MSVRMLTKGVLSWVPGVQRAFYDRDKAGGTASASYCYGVWLKHLAILSGHGMDRIPGHVLELGPGASLGAGIAALLSGAQRYTAIDAIPHMRPEANRAVFAELVGMFRARAPRPTAGFPPFEQYLDERLFPSPILSESRLEAALDDARLARIEHAIESVGDPTAEETIRYSTGAHSQPVGDASVDLAFSHVVLNHVEDLEGLYKRLARWVAPGGWMSHHVDFTALGTASEWNGHRAYSELMWKLILGRRPYFVNREPLATHLRLLDQTGFDLVHLVRGSLEGGIARSDLAPRWRNISDADLGTQTGFMVARRRA